MRIKKVLRGIKVLIVLPFSKIYRWFWRKQEVSIIKGNATELFKDEKRRQRFYAEMNRARRKQAFKTL